MSDQRKLDDYLRRLPAATPPAGLGQRIVDRHLRRRRLRRLLAPAMAAGLLLGVLALRPGAPDPPTEQAVATAGSSAALIDLRSADRRLQAAYLHGADEAQKAALWQARAAALARVEQPTPAATRQVRL